MRNLVLAIMAVAAIAMAVPADAMAGGGFFSSRFRSRRGNVQRVVVQRQRSYVAPQRVVVQRQRVHHVRQFVAPQVVYTQPMVQPTYSAFVQQQQHIAPARVQQQNVGGCQAFFSGGY